MRTTMFLLAALCCLIFTAADSSAYWEQRSAPGIYDGKDSQGAIKCLGTTQICFTLWFDRPGPAPNPNGGSGSYSCIGYFDANASEGKMGAGTCKWTAISGGYSWAYIPSGSVTVVNSMSAAIAWLNANYP